MTYFHYTTCKYVVLKEKSLGVAYYITALLIVVYVLVQLVGNKAYLEFDNSPSGNLRIITNSPPLKDNELHLKAEVEHCCKDSSKKSDDRKSCHACIGLDGLSLNWPVESKAVTIATYIKDRWEETGHDQSDPEKFIIIREDSYFTKNPEHVVLKIEHSVVAFSSFKDPYAASHRMMNGWLVSSDGKIMKQLNNNASKGADKIRLKELLEVAGIKSLNQNSDALNARSRTYRENGIVLRVTIDYSNSEDTLFWTGSPRYKFIVQRLPYSDYKVKQEIPIFEGSRFENLHNGSRRNRRIVKKRFSVRIEFSQAGRIGRFSASNMIFQLVSGLGLLNIATMIIDTLVLYILPHKKLYSQYIYEQPEMELKCKKS